MLLEHILESIRAIESYVKGVDEEAFLKQGQVQDAVMRRLGIVGEAAKHVPPEFKARHPELPWNEMAGLRDKLIRHYFGVDLRNLIRRTPYPDEPNGTRQPRHECRGFRWVPDLRRGQKRLAALEEASCRASAVDWLAIQEIASIV